MNISIIFKYVVWCGVVWCGGLRCGVVWCGALLDSSSALNEQSSNVPVSSSLDLVTCKCSIDSRTVATKRAAIVGVQLGTNAMTERASVLID